MIIEGTEYCAYCDTGFDYAVDKDTWVVPCWFCGRPTILCDKCNSIFPDADCSRCPHRKTLEEKLEVWSKGEIGKVLYVDSDRHFAKEYAESGWYKVIDFDKGYQYILKSLADGKTVKTFGEIIDFSKKSDENN